MSYTAIFAVVPVCIDRRKEKINSCQCLASIQITSSNKRNTLYQIPKDHYFSSRKSCNPSSHRKSYNLILCHTRVQQTKMFIAFYNLYLSLPHSLSSFSAVKKVNYTIFVSVVNCSISYRGKYSTYHVVGINGIHSRPFRKIIHIITWQFHLAHPKLQFNSNCTVQFGKQRTGKTSLFLSLLDLRMFGQWYVSLLLIYKSPLLSRPRPLIQKKGCRRWQIPQHEVMRLASLWWIEKFCLRSVYNIIYFVQIKSVRRDFNLTKSNFFSVNTPLSLVSQMELHASGSLIPNVCVSPHFKHFLDFESFQVHQVQWWTYHVPSTSDKLIYKLVQKQRYTQ